MGTNQIIGPGVHIRCADAQEILEVEQIMDEQTGLELTPENVDKVLGEIRPYLIGTGGGGLDMVGIDGPIVKVRIYHEVEGAAGSWSTDMLAVWQQLCGSRSPRCLLWLVVVLPPVSK